MSPSPLACPCWRWAHGRWHSRSPRHFCSPRRPWLRLPTSVLPVTSSQPQAWRMKASQALGVLECLSPRSLCQLKQRRQLRHRVHVLFFPFMKFLGLGTYLDQQAIWHSRTREASPWQTFPSLHRSSKEVEPSCFRFGTPAFVTA